MLGDEFTIDKNMTKARKKELKTARCPLCSAKTLRTKSKEAKQQSWGVADGTNRIKDITGPRYNWLTCPACNY